MDDFYAPQLVETVKSDAEREEELAAFAREPQVKFSILSNDEKFEIIKLHDLAYDNKKYDRARRLELLEKELGARFYEREALKRLSPKSANRHPGKQWLPIQGAPKDGTPIVGAYCSEDGVVRIASLKWNRMFSEWENFKLDGIMFARKRVFAFANQFESIDTIPKRTDFFTT